MTSKLKNVCNSTIFVFLNYTLPGLLSNARNCRLIIESSSKLLSIFYSLLPFFLHFTLRKYFDMLPTYMQHVDTLVSELGNLIPELNNVSNRSKAMLTCYPGHGARYVKHTDNHCRLGKGGHCNGRRLTTLIYLNEGWEKKDGGEKILNVFFCFFFFIFFIFFIFLFFFFVALTRIFLSFFFSPSSFRGASLVWW